MLPDEHPTISSDRFAEREIELTALSILAFKDNRHDISDPSNRVMVPSPPATNTPPPVSSGSTSIPCTPLLHTGIHARNTC